LDAHGVVTRISDLDMEVKRADLGLEIDKNMSLGKGRKLCIFKNLVLLIYYSKNRVKWSVDRSKRPLRYAF